MIFKKLLRSSRKSIIQECFFARQFLWDNPLDAFDFDTFYSFNFGFWRWDRKENTFQDFATFTKCCLVHPAQAPNVHLKSHCTMQTHTIWPTGAFLFSFFLLLLFELLPKKRPHFSMTHLHFFESQLHEFQLIYHFSSSFL